MISKNPCAIVLNDHLIIDENWTQVDKVESREISKSEKVKSEIMIIIYDQSVMIPVPVQ